MGVNKNKNIAIIVSVVFLFRFQITKGIQDEMIWDSSGV